MMYYYVLCNYSCLNLDGFSLYCTHIPTYSCILYYNIPILHISAYYCILIHMVVYYSILFCCILLLLASPPPHRELEGRYHAGDPDAQNFFKSYKLYLDQLFTTRGRLSIRK